MMFMSQQHYKGVPNIVFRYFGNRAPDKIKTLGMVTSKPLNCGLGNAQHSRMRYRLSFKLRLIVDV